MLYNVFVCPSCTRLSKDYLQNATDSSSRVLTLQEVCRVLVATVEPETVSS